MTPAFHNAPHWLAMSRLAGPEFIWCRGGHELLLGTPRTRRIVTTLQGLRQYAGFTMQFDPFFKWWRVAAHTPVARDLCEELLVEFQMAPMPPLSVQCAMQVVGQGGPGSFWFSDDVYFLRLQPQEPAALAITRLADRVGAAREWGKVLQVMTRNNDAHRLIRAEILGQGIRLDSRFLDGFQPAEGLPSTQRWVGALAA